MVSMCAISLSVAAIEVVHHLQTRHYQGFDTSDPVLGWKLKAGYSGWYTGENRVWVRINSDGLRDREHALIAAPGTIRVAVLGDSYMEALSLPFEKSFVPLLEDGLSECLLAGDHHAEVINFGVSGYGTAQEWLTYQHAVRKYSPDIVLLSVFTANDLLDNSPTFPVPTPRPYFVLRDGALEEMTWRPVDRAGDIPPHHEWRIALTERFFTAALLWDGWLSIRPFVLGEPQVHPAPPPEISEFDLKKKVYEAPQDATMQNAWAVTEALIAAIARDVTRDGAEFWVMTLSNEEQVHPEAAVRAQHARSFGVGTLFYPDDRLRDWANTQRIPLISLSRPLADYASKNHGFLHGGYNSAFPGGTGHWNEVAHQLAANLAGERLCASSRTIGSRTGGSSRYPTNEGDSSGRGR